MPHSNARVNHNELRIMFVSLYPVTVPTHVYQTAWCHIPAGQTCHCGEKLIPQPSADNDTFWLVHRHPDIQLGVSANKAVIFSHPSSQTPWNPDPRLGTAGLSRANDVRKPWNTCSWCHCTTVSVFICLSKHKVSQCQKHQ